MGEWSKKIGEHGEDVVANFLNLIGWSDPLKGIQLPCMTKEHCKEDSDPTTHGIDFLYSEKSNAEHGLLQNMVISAKYTASEYPSAPRGKFKEHFFDLTKTIQCFKRSEIRGEMISAFEHEDVEDIGILFWLSKESEESFDLMPDLVKTRKLDTYPYKTIFVMDNKRVSFIYYTLNHIKAKNPGFDVDFFYPPTGKNLWASERKSYGSSMPVESLTSNIQTYITSKGKDLKLNIFTSDSFDINDLRRLIGLSQSLSSGLVPSVEIYFPDYHPLEHNLLINRVKTAFSDKKFIDKVEVSTYSTTFEAL